MTFVWLAIVIVLGIIEFSTTNLVTIWFIASGLISMFLAYFKVKFIIQFAVFVLVGTLLLVTTRKSLTKILENTKEKTNFDRVLDMTGIVTENIEPDGIGEVKVDGKKWSAISEDNSEIKKDCKVKILKIDGVKLIVKEEK